MKTLYFKQLAASLVAMLLSMTISAQTSGTCGDNLSWSYNSSTSTLTISGTGAMNDFIFSQPWESYCSSITSISLPNELTTIGNYAFYKCSAVSSITIPESVTSIGSSAFYACTDLTSITISSSVTSIGIQAFSYCSSLTSITIPSSVTSIGERAFQGCSGLTSIAIPESVTSIKTGLFSNCSGLTSITIPEGVTSIGNNAFQVCTGLTSITIPSRVTSIGNYAFQGCSGLTSITIPEGVISIGADAFSNCSSLTSLSVASGNTVYDSREDCNAIIETGTNKLLAGCKSTIIPSSVTSIGEAAFQGCSGLTSATIPAGVTNIGNYAFYQCSGLTSITIPEGVTSIGNSAFNGCSGLTSVTIPGNVTAIGDFAFDRCSSLSSITISEGVTGIGDCAFQLGTSLTSVTIPSSVTSIGNYAFNECSNLTSVTALNPTPVSIATSTFSNHANATLYVPSGSIAAYEAADYWKEFGEIKEVTLPHIDLVDGETYTGHSNAALDADTITYSRTFKNTNWQPWYVPFDMTLTSELLENFSFAKFAGTYNAEDGTFYLTIVRLSGDELVKANVPYFVQAKTADSNNAQDITVQNTTLYPALSYSLVMHSAEKEITVTGIYSPKVVTEEDQGWYAYSGGRYSLQTKLGNTLGGYRFFVTIEDREDNPYATRPNPTEVKIKVLGEDDATDLKDLKDFNDLNNAIYDLQGRRVETPSKGIYIVNGRKVLIK